MKHFKSYRLRVMDIVPGHRDINIVHLEVSGPQDVELRASLLAQDKLKIVDLIDNNNKIIKRY